MASFKETMVKFARAVFVRAQKVLLPACLFCAYFLGIGPMAAVSRLARLLRRRAPENAVTFWKPAAGYEADEAESLEQS
ncbi:MAG: hypothetical protein NDI60_03955 [Elusimicrobiales bacterium]|nr:hypothetical protein [Elusimicrobiales bacterium]